MSKKISEEKSSYLGIDPIPRLLLRQALPAAIGFMVMSLNMVVDTFFVGQYIGELAIGAISRFRISVPECFNKTTFSI